jgi:hypothetical protein
VRDKPAAKRGHPMTWLATPSLIPAPSPSPPTARRPTRSQTRKAFDPHTGDRYAVEQRTESGPLRRRFRCPPPTAAREAGHLATRRRAGQAGLARRGDRDRQPRRPSQRLLR